MKPRYRLIRRGIRGGAFYCVDTRTGKRTSLKTADEDAARQQVEAKNISERQPSLNLQIAKAYLMGSDSAFESRTWGHAIDVIASTKKGANKSRWERVAKDKALIPILSKVLIETPGEVLFEVLKKGTVSTNVFLRRIHNFCVDMKWLPCAIIPKPKWPAIEFGEKRAITWEEHCRIVEREKNPERKAFYRLAWHLGASQSDLANLQAANVNWEDRVITYFRMKTKKRHKQPPVIRFGKEVEEILASLPKQGPLFPYLQSVREADRATEFRQRCQGLDIQGITLHSYRYAWAERSVECDYPERFARLALGHNSKAVFQAYAKNAKVTIPPLEEFEHKSEAEILRVQFTERLTSSTATPPPAQLVSEELAAKAR